MRLRTAFIVHSRYSLGGRAASVSVCPPYNYAACFERVPKQFMVADELLASEAML